MKKATKYMKMDFDSLMGIVEYKQGLQKDISRANERRLYIQMQVYVTRYKNFVFLSYNTIVHVYHS